MSTIAQAVKSPRRLRRIPRSPGETREVILAYDAAAGRIEARLVRVEGGGVDRTTGHPCKVYFELTAKVPREPEVTRIFAGQGDPVRGEINARVAYLMAQHGCVDFTRPVGELGPRLWPEPKNLTALARLAEAAAASGTRMNSGDSHTDLVAGGWVAPRTRPVHPEASSGLPWWAGSDAPVWPAPGSQAEPRRLLEGSA
jgi:hypothetical protein